MRIDEMQFYQSPESVANVRGRKIPFLRFILLEGRFFRRREVVTLDVRNTRPYTV